MHLNVWLLESNYGSKHHINNPKQVAYSFLTHVIAYIKQHAVPWALSR